MKKMLIIIYIILLLILFKLIFAFSTNEKFILQYKKGIYAEDEIKKLFVLNISEPYIAYYNYGNVLYKNGNYNGAIKEYQTALKLNPPKKEKECAIRINLALAMLKKIDEIDTNDTSKILNILDAAKNILCENGCAHREDNNGHSKEAEQLKADIERKIRELKNEENTEEKSSDEESKEEKNNERNEKTKQQKLQEIQKETLNVRQETLDGLKQMTVHDSYNEYYKGKKW